MRRTVELVPTPPHFGVFGVFRFHGYILTVTLTDNILKSYVNPFGISFEIGGVKIITNRNEPGMAERKHPLNEIACLNVVAAKPGEILYDDTVNSPACAIIKSSYTASCSKFVPVWPLSHSGSDMSFS